MRGLRIRADRESAAAVIIMTAAEGRLIMEAMTTVDKLVVAVDTIGHRRSISTAMEEITSSWPTLLMGWWIRL